METLVNWSGRPGIAFYLRSNEIRGVKDITISAAVEAEDTTADGEKFQKLKNTGSYQISLTAVLHGQLGVDVKTVAIDMTEAARCGDSGYFYIGSEKLFPSAFMAVDAKIQNLKLTSKGEWLYCEVALTLKQCSKYGGGSAGTGKGGSASGGAGGTKAPETESKEYTVQIPGMAEIKVKATGVQDAITQACGKNWTGTILVNGIEYTVNKGVLTNVIQGALSDAANATWSWFENVGESMSAARKQSQKVDTDANTKKTGTNNTTSGKKPALKLKNANYLKD